MYVRDTWKDDAKRMRCNSCQYVGAELIDTQLDGGGPGQYWMMKYKCLSCGKESWDYEGDFNLQAKSWCEF
tara:strand:- start:10240 stop:10452 length:213 start_codon:yes stop_codon:yes gene_type:complete